MVLAVKFSAALGFPDVAPVGGAIAGAGKALTFHESLEKHGGVLVAGVPIVGQSFGGEGEYLGGEISRSYPGQNEKPGVVDDEVKIFYALLGSPADEVVAWRDFPCRGTKTESGQKLTARAVDEVADLSTGKRLVSKVVMTLDQLVP